MIESLYLSVFCPLQLLMVGEPLARPFAPRIDMKTSVTTEDTGQIHIISEAISSAPIGPFRYSVFLDGEKVVEETNKTDFRIPVKPELQGCHEVLVTAYSTGLVQYVTTGRYYPELGHRRVRLGPPETGTNIPLHVRTFLPVTSPTDAKHILLFRGGDALATASAHTSVIEFDPQGVGPGPCRLTAVAQCKNGISVRSPPLALNILRPEPPPLMAIQPETDAKKKRLLLRPLWEDNLPPGVILRWYQDCAIPVVTPQNLADRFQVYGGSMSSTTNGYVLHGTDDNTAVSIGVPVSLVDTLKLDEVAVRLAMSGAKPTTSSYPMTGIAFHVQDQHTFDFFGYRIDQAAWVIGSCVDGKYMFTQQRGGYLERGTQIRLSLHADQHGIHGQVNGEEVCIKERSSFRKGARAGIFTTSPSVHIFEILASPPNLPRKVLEVKKDVLRIYDLQRAQGNRFILQADNGFTQSHVRYDVEPL